MILLAIMTLFAGAVNSLYAGAPGSAGNSKEAKKILVFGDSLVAGYGIPLEQAFPAQLEARLKKEGENVTVINAGVSGDTTSGGLTRLEWTLAQNPDYVILELGANDMLRGTDPEVTRDNLRKMLEILKQKKIPVLLAGMKALPNYGIPYMLKFNGLYKPLAKKYDAVYYPFFLEDVATKQNLQLEDGMHPNPAGVAVIVENILPKVKDLLEEK